MSETAIQSLEHIEAQLNYLSDTSEKPVAYAYEPPPGRSLGDRAISGAASHDP
jgi:hypothetical protein